MPVGRDGVFLDLILAGEKAEYFSAQDWTPDLPDAQLICRVG
jgi:hypothetical protein